MGKAIDFLTPVGRLVQGDCFEGQTKDNNGKPYLDGQGNPTTKWFVAVAFAKSDPAFAALKQQMDQLARTEFPHLFPNGGPCINPNFSMKIVDGDGIDNNGRPNNSKEGFAGHWILRMGSSYPPKCYQAGKYQPHEQLKVEGGINPIPRGHYVRVAGNMLGNGGGNGKPGLYVNCSMVEWVRIGDVIVSGPDAATVFGGQSAPAANSNAAPPPPATQTAVQQHQTILQGPQLTAKATSSYAQYIASGWTDAQLIEHGIMLAPTASHAAPPPPAVQTAAPPPPAAKRSHQDRMLATAGATFAQYIESGWNEQQLIDNGLMAAA